LAAQPAGNVPNNFLVNISPDERPVLEAFLQAHGLGRPQMYPMVRARMTAINGQPASSIKLKGDNGRGFLEREQNLTWSDKLMDDNQLVAGSWWSRRITASRWCRFLRNTRRP
jgi:putative ABC transport system permease protein